MPEALVKAIRTTIHSKWLFLIALNLFLLVVGALMDIFSAIVAVPLILPLAAEYGVHPLHLAIIFLLNLEIAYSTPPVGLNLVIASFYFRQSMIRLYRCCFAFLIVALLVLGGVTYVEKVSTFTAPKGGVVIKGGMGGDGVATPQKTPAKKAGPAPAAGSGSGSSGKPVMDGICDPKVKDDPDCDDIKIDD